VHAPIVCPRIELLLCAEDVTRLLPHLGCFSLCSPWCPDVADPAAMFPGQQGYGDASQSGACLLALDPVFLIRLALQQQIEYYFRSASNFFSGLVHNKQVCQLHLELVECLAF